MLKVLLELCESHLLASFYTDAMNTEKFIFGKILAISEAKIVFQSVSPDGEDDGIVLMPIDKVFRVEEGGQYSAKMHKLVGNIPDYRLNICDNDLETSVLFYAQSKPHLVSIELLDSGCDNVVGFVENVEDGECKVRLVDEYGYGDGLSYFYVKDITQISMLSQIEKRIESLWQANEMAKHIL